MTRQQHLSWQYLVVLVGLSPSLSPAIAAVPNFTPTDNSLDSAIGQSGLPKQDRGQPGSTIGGGTFNLPETNRGQPDSTQGAGKRGGCIPQSDKGLFRVVLPVTGNPSLAIADTISAAPSLWGYLPENEGIIKAEFKLYARNNPNVDAYSQMIENLSDKSGLLQVTLPNNALEANTEYFWDLTFICEGDDRSADPYVVGSMTRQNINQLSMRNETAVIDSLVAILKGQNSYLTLDAAETSQLAIALESSGNLAMVEARLRDHLIALQNDYAKLNQSIVKLNQNPNVNMAELALLKAQRSDMMLELAQLSAFFDLWGDVSNFLAMGRADNPGEWNVLLESLFPQDDPTTDEKEDRLLRLLQTAPNLEP